MFFFDEPVAASTARVEASSEQPMLPGLTLLHQTIVARVPIDFPLSQSVFFILWSFVESTHILLVHTDIYIYIYLYIYILRCML